MTRFKVLGPAHNRAVAERRIWGAVGSLLVLVLAVLASLIFEPTGVAWVLVLPVVSAAVILNYIGGEAAKMAAIVWTVICLLMIFLILRNVIVWETRPHFGEIVGTVDSPKVFLFWVMGFVFSGVEALCGFLAAAR